MRYLNTKTLRTQTESNEDNIISTDDRVKNWYKSCPDGYRGEWVEGIYTFVEIPPISDEVLLAQSKAIKLKEIGLDYIATDSEVVKVTHTAHGEITYIGGSDSAKSVRDYIDGNRLEGTTTHNIWDINGTETEHTDAEADSVLIALNSKARTDKFTKKNRKVAVAVATTIADVELA